MFDGHTIAQIADALAARLKHQLRPAPVPPRDLLDVSEVATRIGQSTKTVRRLIESGELKAVHINSRLQVRAATLEEFLRVRERRN